MNLFANMFIRDYFPGCKAFSRFTYMMSTSSQLIIYGALNGYGTLNGYGNKGGVLHIPFLK